MGKRYIDCSLSIVTSHAWQEYPRRLSYAGGREPGIKVEPMATVKEQGVANFFLQLSTQCFTHIESKAHVFDGGRTLDDVPLEWFINDGIVIDMMHKQAGEGVTANDLEAANPDVREGDTIIIRTGWTDKCFATREFWANIVHLTEDAADWIISKKPRALMQDFHTDVPPLRECECCGNLGPIRRTGGRQPNHPKLLGTDMLLIEWCTNLGAITKKRVQVIALPLKIKDTEGAPARVIVVEED